MNWRQFLTPVKSIDANEAKAYLADKNVDAVTILDVRQPKEYETGHIPGAVLAPLPELTDHLSRIDRDKPVLVYCAVGRTQPRGGPNAFRPGIQEYHQSFRWVQILVERCGILG